MPITVTVEKAQANLYQYLNQLDAATLDKVIVTDGGEGPNLLQIVTWAVYAAADPGNSAAVTTDVVAAYSASPAVYAAPLYKLIKGMRDREAAPDAQKGTGTITCVAKALIIDNEIVTLTDAGGNGVTFEFNQTGGYTPTPGAIEVDISGDTTAADVATTLAAVIAANGFVAPAPAAAVIDVTQVDPGTGGNTTITDTVVDVGFLVAGFVNGTDASAAGGVVGLKTSKNDDAPRAAMVPEDHAVAIGL